MTGAKQPPKPKMPAEEIIDDDEIAAGIDAALAADAAAEENARLRNAKASRPDRAITHPAIPPDKRPKVPVRKEIDLEEPVLDRDGETKRGHAPIELLEESRGDNEPPSIRDSGGLRLPPRGPIERDVEATDMDLALVLGGPQLRAPPPPVGPPAEKKSGGTQDLPARRLQDVLREADTAKAKKKAPKDGANAEDIKAAVVASETLARVIPLLLAAFMLLGMILVSVKMASSSDSSGGQEHVELRLLGQGGAPAVVPDDKMTRISVDTRPAGLVVLYNREILGRSPFLVDMPVRLIEPVMVEITGPYYEVWIGRLTRDPNGEYQVSADLRRRKEE